MKRERVRGERGGKRETNRGRGERGRRRETGTEGGGGGDRRESQIDPESRTHRQGPFHFVPIQSSPLW